MLRQFEFPYPVERIAQQRLRTVSWIGVGVAARDTRRGYVVEQTALNSTRFDGAKVRGKSPPLNGPEIPGRSESGSRRQIDEGNAVDGCHIIDAIVVKIPNNIIVAGHPSSETRLVLFQGTIGNVVTGI